MPRILCIDDDQDQCELLELVLKRLGYEATSTTSPTHALELVEGAQEFAAILTDLGMSEMGGLALCERMLASRPDIPVIVVTGFGSMEAAIAAMRAGAYDFLTKPLDSKLLGLSVARASQHHALRSEVQRLRQALSEPVNDAGLVGDSPPMKRLHEMIARVATTDASALIQGETGTGKELVARALHAKSARSRGPFVALNCAAVPPNLLESELFGHARGAFTDAKDARKGLFLEATQGTLFLDEIGEMPLEMQAKLLRALQERSVRPVGSDAEVPFDVRIVAATHRDLEADVEARRFREDLFYRIHVVRIDVPPLRARGSDVLKLASLFLERAGARSGKRALGLSPEVAERLLAYDFPGNVRELENCIERAVALARFEQLTVDDLPEKIKAHRTESFLSSTQAPEDIISLEELEQRYIHRVLRLLGGNKAHAAELLGLDRRTLQRKLERYGVAQAQPALDGPTP